MVGHASACQPSAACQASAPCQQSVARPDDAPVGLLASAMRETAPIRPVGAMLDGQRGTTSMTSQRSSVARRARALRAVTALPTVFLFFALGWPRGSAASRENRGQAAPAASRQAKLMAVPLSFEPNQGQAASTVQF